MRLISLTLWLIQAASLATFAQTTAGYIKNDVVPGVDWHLEKPESLGYSVSDWPPFALGSRPMIPRR